MADVSQDDQNLVQEEDETSNGEVVADQSAPVQPAPAQQEQAYPGFFSVIKGFAIRALVIYFVTSYFRGTPQPATNSTLTTGGAAATKIPASNMVMDGSSLDLYVYLSEKDKFDFSSPPVWLKEDLIYGDWGSGPTSDGIYTYSFSVEPSRNVMNNGSLYIHGYMVKNGFSPNPKDAGRYHRPSTMYVSQKVNKYHKRRYEKTSNLITGKTELSDEEIMKAETMKEEITSHWHPNITINLVHDFTNWVRGSVPPPLDEFLEFSPAGDQYKPIVFVNTYWNLYREYMPINETSETLNMTITLQPLSLFKWQMYAAQTMKSKWNFMDGLNSGDEDENQDALKEMFLETSPYLLALTGIVSLLHSIFEMLAFKNDVQFWNNRKSLEGLSVRSVFFNVFQSLIVLLYVMDNETNFVIKMSCFVGLCIELWKITKVMDVSVNWERRIMGLPTLSFKDRGTYVQSQTKRFDEIAFKYLGMLFFPLLGCYVVYSLIYHEHKGWYSFVLSMLYGFLLTFGFIMMTPQLFINYKMKSVAHLPWRMLTYKALNTFIDDIFAFVIKMPTMYRLGCFRDDIVFFIFLYQRYVYPIDPSRVNEFGFSQEQENLAKQAKKGGKIDNNETKPKSLEAKKKD